MSFSPVELWIIIGVICLAIEFTKLPGIGFLFLGLGALSSAILNYNYPQFFQNNYIVFADFGLLSFLWLIILWAPLRKYGYSKVKKQDYFDMIGSEVEVCSRMVPRKLGQVKWSGTIMNAKLAETETEAAEENTKLYIRQIHGNILICSRNTKS